MMMNDLDMNDLRLRAFNMADDLSDNGIYPWCDSADVDGILDGLNAGNFDDVVADLVDLANWFN